MPVAGSKADIGYAAQQCGNLTSFSLLDELVAFNNDHETKTCMKSGMAAIPSEVANTCTLSQVQGSPPCGTECWPILKQKILSVLSECQEEKYPGLEKYHTCLVDHSCDTPPRPPACHDTDGGYADSSGDPCYRYHGNSGWCGQYDTSNFHSYSMCCACGGGSFYLKDQSAADVMKDQGAADVMEGYLSDIYLKLSHTAPESPIPMMHAKPETLSLALAFTGGALTAIVLGVIGIRLKDSRSSAAEPFLA